MGNRARKFASVPGSCFGRFTMGAYVVASLREEMVDCWERLGMECWMCVGC